MLKNTEEISPISQNISAEVIEASHDLAVDGKEQKRFWWSMTQVLQEIRLKNSGSSGI